MLDLDPRMPVGMPLHESSPPVGDPDRREVPRAVACGAKARSTVQSAAMSCKRSERGGLTRLVEDTGDTGRQVELRPEPVEGRGGVACDEHGIGGRRRPPCGRREHVARSRQRLGVERRMELLDVEAMLA